MQPTINVGNAVVAPAGAPLGRIVTFTNPVLDTYKVEIDPGTGVFVPYSGVLYTSSLPGGTKSFEFNNAYANPGTYNVIFRVHAIDTNGVDSYRDADLVVNVFTPQQFASLDETATQMITSSGQSANIGVGGMAADGTSTQVDASLGGDPGASVFAGSYKNDPTGSQPAGGGQDLIKVGPDNSTSALPTAFFDLRASGVDADSTLTTTFTVEIDPSQDISAIKLYYSNGTSWLPVESDPNFPITKTITGIDPLTGKEIVKIEFTATKDSKPSIFDLHGTVFTVALPAPEAAPITTPVSGPAATLAAPPTTALTATFSSDAGGTFVLRVSQVTDLSASRTEASTSAAASVTGASSSYDSDEAVRLAREALDINWLLGVIEQADEGANPAGPAAGGEQQERAPVQPARPEAESQGPEESFEIDAVDAMFAKEFYEEAELSPGAVSLHVPTAALRDTDSDVCRSAPAAAC